MIGNLGRCSIQTSLPIYSLPGINSEYLIALGPVFGTENLLLPAGKMRDVHTHPKGFWGSPGGPSTKLNRLMYYRPCILANVHND